MKINLIFDLHAAKSKSIDDYEYGKIPFITNAELNNGIAQYVEPFEDDKVFNGPLICISGLGHATVHFGSVLPKGNGGDSCTILVPIQSMSAAELFFYAALFNTLHSWRFSFGRKANIRRLETLKFAQKFLESSVDIESFIQKQNHEITSLITANESQILGIDKSG